MRPFAALMLVLSLILAMFGIASAQVAGTPGSAVDQPVSIYGPDGAEAAQISVVEYIDPFEDWAEYYDPQVGERYIVVVYEIANTGTRPFAYETYDFYLHDAQGYLYQSGFSSRSPQSIAQTPDLEEMSMLPGESIVGALMYTVPADATIDQAIYLAYVEDGPMYASQALFVLATVGS